MVASAAVQVVHGAVHGATHHKRSLASVLLNHDHAQAADPQPAAECPSTATMVYCCMALTLLALSAALYWTRTAVVQGAAGRALCAASAAPAVVDAAGASKLKEEKKPKSRMALVDNAKFLLMVLVVWQHIPNFADSMFHVNLPGGGLATAVWFHMPAFAVLSGMVWSPFTSSSSRRFVSYTVAPIVLSMLIIPTVMSIGMRKVGKDNEWSEWDATKHPIQAGLLGSGPGELWYLRCIVMWRLVSQALSVLPPGAQLAVSAAVGVAGAALSPVSFTKPQWLGPFALVRGSQMFPFYVLGQHLPWQRLFEVVGEPGAKTLAASWTAFFAMCAFFESDWRGPVEGVMRQVETFPDPYMSMQTMSLGGCGLEGALVAGRYVVGFFIRLVQVAAFLCFAVPRGETWFTTAGSHSIYPYLAHAPVVYLVVLATVTRTGELAFPSLAPVIVPLWFLAAVAISMLLTAAPVRWSLGLAAEPHWVESGLIRLGWK